MSLFLGFGRCVCVWHIHSPYTLHPIPYPLYPTPYTDRSSIKRDIELGAWKPVCNASLALLWIWICALALGSNLDWYSA